MSGELQKHQIEELLLNAHLESEGGIDLIEEYFNIYRSLDRVTEYAKELLQKEKDREVQSAIVKNLAECIVVKTQRDQQSLVGVTKRFLEKRGLYLRKNGEVRRAEQLVETFRNAS